MPRQVHAILVAPSRIANSMAKPMPQIMNTEISEAPGTLILAHQNIDLQPENERSSTLGYRLLIEGTLEPYPSQSELHTDLEMTVTKRLFIGRDSAEGIGIVSDFSCKNSKADCPILTPDLSGFSLLLVFGQHR